MIQLPTTDRAWGIERNPHSQMFNRRVLGGPGQLPIILWKKPGCEMDANNVTGALAHDTEVQVIRAKQHDGRLYFFVKCTIQHEGKTYPQRGWLLKGLLKDIGSHEENEQQRST